MSILGSATSGLTAFRRGLATTSHNISNSKTDGYSRQRVETQARRPVMSGAGYMGQGVSVSGIRRMQSDILDGQLRSSIEVHAKHDTKAATSGRLDKLIGSDTTGLQKRLGSFFASVQDLTTDPSSLPSRTVMLGEAQALTERLEWMNRRFDEQRQMIDGDIARDVGELNQQARALADLNERLAASQTRPGSQPNDLLDARDQLLREMSEKADLTVLAADNNAVNVFIGKGQALVMGSHARTIVAEPLGDDPTEISIGIENNTGETADITRYISGGSLGGLVETRTEVLDSAQRQLGLIGLNLTAKFNEQNRLGVDLNGDLGGDIFTQPEVMVYGGPDNVGTGKPTVTITDPTKLAATDYRLVQTTPGPIPPAAPAYELQGLSPKTSVALTQDATDPNLYHAESIGLDIDTSGLAGLAEDDRWIIQPTRHAAGGFDVAITDPKKLATADAVTAKASELNTGNAEISELSTTDPGNADLRKRAVVTFEAGPPSQYTVLTDNTPPAVPVTPTVEEGITTIAANGWEMKFKGTMADGDMLVVTANDPQTGDNNNGRALADIQTAELIGGRDTLQAGYNSIIAEVGTATRHAQVSRDSSATVMASAWNQRESLSGVNLDEEAANMISYQEAYKAAAQMLATAKSTFDTLLSVMR